MDSGDLNSQLGDLKETPLGVNSLDVKNIYDPVDAHMDQALPFGARYCANSGDPFHVEMGMHPSNFSGPWFNEGSGLAACHGRNFGNNMLLPSPCTVRDIVPLRASGPMNPSWGLNYAYMRGRGPMNPSWGPNFAPIRGSGPMNAAWEPNFEPIRGPEPMNPSWGQNFVPTRGPGPMNPPGVPNYGYMRGPGPMNASWEPNFVPIKGPEPMNPAWGPNFVPIKGPGPMRGVPNYGYMRAPGPMNTSIAHSNVSIRDPGPMNPYMRPSNAPRRGPGPMNTTMADSTVPFRAPGQMDPYMMPSNAPHRGPGPLNSSMAHSIVPIRAPEPMIPYMMPSNAPPRSPESISNAMIMKSFGPLMGPASTNMPSVSVGGNELQGAKEISNIKDTEAVSHMRKGRWTKEETRKLCELVGKFGTKKWAQIAENIPGRVGQQCRERWNNYARPDIKKDKWTEQEEMWLVQAHRDHGTSWSKHAKLIPCRDENDIKNYWYSSVRKFICSGSKMSSIMKDYIESLPAKKISIKPSATANPIENLMNTVANYMQYENSDHLEGYDIQNNNFQLVSELQEGYTNKSGAAISNNQLPGLMNNSVNSESEAQNPSGADSELGNPNTLLKEVERAALFCETTELQGNDNMESTTTRDDDVNWECEMLNPSGVDSELGKQIPKEKTGVGYGGDII